MTKRNDSTLKNSQQLQLQDWELTVTYCVEYLTKYATKGKPRSPLLKQGFNSIVQNANRKTDPITEPLRKL